MIDLNALVAETLKYGFPGVVIIALAWVLYKVVQQSKVEHVAKDERLEKLRAEKDELQEKRIAEGRESLNALNNATNVLQDVLAAVSSIQNGGVAK